MALLIQPLPWRVVEGRVIDTNDFSVVHGVTPDEAEFIVKACNHHDELVSALKNLSVEVSAMLGLIEFEMREAAGNTNVNVLRLRWEEAKGLLAKVKDGQ